jgi:hypothetical protein
VGEEVRAAEAQIDATESQITVARSAALPQLRVNGGYTQTIENARAAIVGSLFGQNVNYNANTNLTQPLFLGGRVRAGLRAARSARTAGREDAAEVRAQVTVDVQRAYLSAQAADRLVAIQDTNLAVSDARVRQLEQLERGGRAARFDVLRARVERANLEPLAVQARNDRELAYVELRRLLNLPADRPLRLTTRVPPTRRASPARSPAPRPTPPPRPPPPRPGAPSCARRRPRSRRAAPPCASPRPTGCRASRASCSSACSPCPTSPRFPTRLGQTSNAVCPPGSPATRVCQNNGFFQDRSAGLTVSWPLFDGLRTRGNIELAEAQARTAELELAQTREQATVEAATARAALRRAGTLATAQRQTVAEATEAFRLAELRFARGLGTSSRCPTRSSPCSPRRPTPCAPPSTSTSRPPTWPAPPASRSRWRGAPHDARTPSARPARRLALAALAAVTAAGACSNKQDAAAAPPGAPGGQGRARAAAARARGHRRDAGAPRPHRGGDPALRRPAPHPERDGARRARGRPRARARASGRRGARRAAARRVRVERRGEQPRRGQRRPRRRAQRRGHGPLERRAGARAVPRRRRRRARGAHRRPGAHHRPRPRGRRRRGGARRRADHRRHPRHRAALGHRRVARVEGNEHVARGADLFTVVRSDVLELAASVPERTAGEVRPGQAVRLTWAAAPSTAPSRA